MPVPTLAIRILQLPHATGLSLPSYMTAGAAGADVCAAVAEPVSIAPGSVVLVPTGLVVEIPEGHEIQIRPRSGLAVKHAVTVVNAPATIDSDYRGEIRVGLINLGREAFAVERGMRIAQMLVAPVIRAEWVEAEALGTTARGEGGFGHSGM